MYRLPGEPRRAGSRGTKRGTNPDIGLCAEAPNDIKPPDLCKHPYVAGVNCVDFNASEGLIDLPTGRYAGTPYLSLPAAGTTPH